MERQRFGKHERLLKRSDFQNVLNHGKKIKVDTLFTLFWLDNRLDCRRLGIIASKKIGKAVLRNRTKRRIREIFRRNKEQMKPALDIVVISGKGTDHLPFLLLESKIMDILQV